MLLRLVSNPGTVLRKDALVEAAWRDVAVTDNSLEQAVSALRRTLGAGYIATVPRRGMAEFERELSFERRGHLYARECCANTWYATGAVHLRRGDSEAARIAFEETLRRVEAHPALWAPALSRLRTRAA